MRNVIVRPNFLAQIEHHLRRVQRIEGTQVVDADRVPDLAYHDAVLVGLFEREAGQSAHPKWVERQFGKWGPHELAYFVDELHWELLAGFGAQLSWQVRRDCIDAAIAIASDLEHPESLVGPRLQRVSDLAHTVNASMRAWGGDHPWQIASLYCEHLGLTNSPPGVPHLKLAGKTLLSLCGIDRVGWLLALEGARGVGPRDKWCVDTSQVPLILRSAGHMFLADDDERPPIPSWSGIVRWSALGVLAEWDDEGEEYGYGSFGYDLTDVGKKLFEDSNADALALFHVQAEIQARDDRNEAFSTGTKVESESQSAAAMQQARLVAHEVRNVLLPIRHALDKVWTLLGTSGLNEAAGPNREQIEAGLARLYRFVEVSVRMSAPVADVATSFPLLDAIEEARRALTAESMGSVRIETQPGNANPECRGHRGRVVLALINILRNAVQHGGPAVQISILVDTRQSAITRILIEDNGPGVPEPLRDRIFDDGVSSRVDGSGYGLALVREVVERDLGGKVTYEPEGNKGARFQIELPTKREEQ